MKKLFIYSSAIVLSFCGLDMAYADDAPAPMDFGAHEQLSVQTSKAALQFDIEVADTQSERARGLMYRDVIKPGEGMLFEFPDNSIASIWMKNTSIFLDVIFVQADGRIVKIEHSAKPYSLRSMSSETPVRAVLEIAGGQALEQGIRPGDLIKHPFFSTK
jgi:uncharacterized membrane protein (UPF0127 family)